MSLIYKKMNLFDAPVGSILVHACNAKGVWGSGIAKDMKQNYPYAYYCYEAECQKYPMIAEFDYTRDQDKIIVSLITSQDYGRNVDSPQEILVNTTIALNELGRYLEDNDEQDKIYSNKFNSGLFKVPWEETEKILKVIVDRYNLNWVVCEI